MDKELLLLTASLFYLPNVSALPLDEIPNNFAKNVIMLIPDGTSQNNITLTRWVYNDGQPLHLDAIASGLVCPHNSDAPIADSAPAASAMATGHKTQDKLISLRPAKANLYGARQDDEKQAFAPIATVLELAKQQGKATGLVATSEIMHATPAAYSAHAMHRNDYDNISEQQVYQNLNVMFGGGKAFLQPEKLKDQQNLLTVLQQKGYQIIENRQDLTRVNGDKVWGLFAPESIPYYVDRTNEPSLAQMTDSALHLLSKNKNGFFLMVEGSKADWASHANLPVAMVGDLKDFDEAVGTALKFAKSNRDTLVIVAADHATGGMIIGHRDLKDYALQPLGTFVSHLRSVKISEQKLAQEIFNNRSSTAMLLKQYLNLNADHTLVKEIQHQKTEEEIQTLIAQWNSKLANLSWTTGGHTGEDVALYVYTLDPKYLLSGTILNSDIARYIEKAFNGNLDQLTEALFVPSSTFTRQGITLKTPLTDDKASQFTLSKNNQEYTFYKNRNYFAKNGQKTEFSGVVVFNGKELFIPKSALNLL